jgi:predicted metal-dependent hydrolase
MPAMKVGTPRRRPPGTPSSHTVRHRGEAISFELVRSDRRTLGFVVKRDGRVVVRAPRRAREADVLQRVAGHGDWILRKRREFAESEQRARLSYVDDEAHLYLGRRYPLAIERGESEGVRLAGRRLRVTLPATTDTSREWSDAESSPECADTDASPQRSVPPPERVRELLDEWYARQAHRVLAERLEACWASFPSDGRRLPVLRLKRMRTRWGSMSAKGSMSLRLDLIRAPQECIDYVIVHELCHLVHPDHGSEFWALVERLVPDWRRRKRRLERVPA